VIATSLAALVTAATGCSSQTSSSNASPGPTRSGDIIRFGSASQQLERIRVAPVTGAVLPIDELDVPGRVEAVPTQLARLALPVPGRIREVRVSIGDRIRKGQLLLTLDTPAVSELQSAWRQAQADVRQREAALAKAQADASRVRDLLANRAIAQKDLLSAETDVTVATAALEQARAAHDDVARRLSLFGVDLEKPDALATLRSPIDGEVVEIAAAPGEYRGDTAAPVVAVADLTHVWVVAAVPESALSRVQTGQHVTMEVAAYPSEPFEGTVARVAGSLDAETRSVNVIAELDNRRRLLKPGMFARVRYAGPAQPVVTVPVGAVLQDERRTSVFVERSRGEFERRDVSLGPRHKDAVVVTSGLSSGERVVVDGTVLLLGQ
jgi:cobalt-zinc-cadmium efflux system membrane fusion protein